jgi:hypothetical protein
VSASEYPTTDVDEIKALLAQCLDSQNALNARLEGQAAGINAIGQNLNWLVQNTQGIFQMFASPQFMSQMSNMLIGGISGNGQQQGSDSSSGSAEGTDSGGS